MKKYRLVFVLFFASFVTEINAQTESGSFLLGGSSKLGFSSTKTKLSAEGESYDYCKTRTLNFSPQFGYFVIDGLVIGLEIPMNYQKEELDFVGNKDRITSISFAIAPFARYYFGDNKIKPFLHGGLGFGKTNVSAGESEETNKISIYNFGGGVGVFISENVSFDGGVFYSSVTKELDDFMGSDITVDEITSGFNFSVGLVVVF